MAVADQFRGLPMADLIGGPLIAASDAQVTLANATASFIKTVGFLPKYTNGQLDQNDPYGDIRTAKFKYNRPVGAATPGDNGLVPTETVELEVPLLAIVKIPSLSITSVDITFDMEVKSSESSKETDSRSGTLEAEASVGWGPFKASVKISGSISSAKEQARSTDSSAKYHVEVHAKDSGMPEGLSRVLDMMNASIAPKSVLPAPANNGTPANNQANRNVQQPATPNG
ncbi:MULTISPECIES: DUF2589 domain-containing protein [Methylomonas]|uniref:DUF2589 domain-containing protein n=1 Tax=Methylomonas TaxID=416 RepID=UPI001231D15F|nr:DUF2589 domain-containing protein [Methylomonas rhizoryzae]